MMKIILVSNQRRNINGIGNPIMYRMCESIQRDKRVSDVEFIPFENTLSSLFKIRRKAKTANIIHIHFGGLYVLIIWMFLLGTHAKKFITFHGTDIHARSFKTAKNLKKKLKIKLNQYASFLAIILFNKTGFVAKEMTEYVPKFLKRILKKKVFIQKLGVDYNTFVPMGQSEAQQFLGLFSGRYILFSDISNTTIKRRDIAEAIINLIGHDYQLLVMCGVQPIKVPYYINASEFLLLTSDEEGSPNIIREVLALNKPVFSVKVGDAPMQLEGLNNSAIISREPAKAAKTILEKLEIPYTDNTRETKISILSFDEVNKEIITLYSETL